MNGFIRVATRFRARPVVFGRGIPELAFVSATLTHAFAHRAVWRRDHPIVGAMRVDVIGYLALVLVRWDHASIYPVLGRL